MWQIPKPAVLHAQYYCDGVGPRKTQRCLSFGSKLADENVGEQLCRVVEPVAIEAAYAAFVPREPGMQKHGDLSTACSAFQVAPVARIRVVARIIRVRRRAPAEFRLLRDCPVPGTGKPVLAPESLSPGGRFLRGRQ